MDTGQLPWWATIWLRWKFGQFRACYGAEFTGIKFTDGSSFNPEDARFINKIRANHEIKKERTDWVDSEGNKHLYSGEAGGDA